LRPHFAFASAVAWCTIASGSFSSTALRTALASSRSTSTGFAPSVRSSSVLPSEWWVPITSWPASINWGTSRLPSAPLAPATKTRIVSSFSLLLSHPADLAGLFPAPQLRLCVLLDGVEDGGPIRPMQLVPGPVER
jgi:hypothetical protein